ncbi:Os05g0445650 [Oryza sativa Japonica Group]|uniref:Os05g0445650 protein n=1 Tax=Oryza sativa subsp. japonica TaxID=39947 RepID=A0A0P0WN60_ORYSJ|nr:hypothetical protein EE612_029824 [Oryza sativa]BAS94280.1 Os05g0445650 [Oryza sativa Japonica Group]
MKPENALLPLDLPARLPRLVLGRRIRGQQVKVASPMAIPLPEMPAFQLLLLPPLRLVAHGAALPRQPPGRRRRRRINSVSKL